MKQIFTIILLLSLTWLGHSQDSIPGMKYTRFLFPNGVVSSEGYLREGKPDGYWKTYYESGKVKAEGNRKDFLLDGTWKFYNEEGELTVSIDYKNSMKNGKRMTFQKVETWEENFENDVKQGWSFVYFPDGKVKQKTNFLDGREQGMAFEYDTSGTIISLIEWRNGFVINREQVNRRDGMGRKQGVWKEFYPSGLLKEECSYKNDLRDGYLKQYDAEGNLKDVFKYSNGELVEDAVEVAEYEIRTDYYPDGKIKIVGTYKNGAPHGVRKEYDKEGNITVVYIFDNGILSSMGMMDDQGKKQGFWKEYYNTGQVMAEGNYSSNVRVGEWVYYYRNGRVEQQGTYDGKGIPDGVWERYYPSGNLWVKEEYANGMLNGKMQELDDKGNIISEGEYVDDLEEGRWMTQVNDHLEKGEYVAGEREGEWKSSFPDGTLYFIGKYVADLPNGKHVWYWDNGNKKLEGLYVMGVKEGDWRRYDYEGGLILLVTYKNGVETKYDGVKVEPEIETEGIE